MITFNNNSMVYLLLLLQTHMCFVIENIIIKNKSMDKTGTDEDLNNGFDEVQ